MKTVFDELPPQVTVSQLADEVESLGRMCFEAFDGHMLKQARPDEDDRDSFIGAIGWAMQTMCEVLAARIRYELIPAPEQIERLEQARRKALAENAAQSKGGTDGRS